MRRDRLSPCATRYRRVFWAAILCTLFGSWGDRLEEPDSGLAERVADGPIFLAAPALSDIESRDVYVDSGTIHGLVAGFDEAGSRAVYYLRSPDHGRTWSDPVAVSHRTAPPVIARHGNDVQIAAAGPHIVAAWPVATALPGLGRLTTAFSRDGGKTWEPGPNPAAETAEIDQGYLDVAADRRGDFHLVWLDDRAESGRHSGVRYTRSVDGGRHWAPSTTLDPASCTCCRLTLASAGDGDLAVLYRDHAPQDMALLRSADRGLRWRREGSVGAFGWDFRGCPHAGGALVISGGRITGDARDRTLDALVWTGRERFQGLYHLRFTDEGRSFGTPIRLGERDAREGDVAVLDRHHLVAVWEAGAPSGSRIVLAESLDGGAHWSAPRPLSRTGVAARHPRVVATALGPRVFWSEAGASGTARFAMTSPEVAPGRPVAPPAVANR
ncbi:MAG: sialidase family protein [Gammaproteobacteria bacterium]